MVKKEEEVNVFGFVTVKYGCVMLVFFVGR